MKKVDLVTALQNLPEGSLPAGLTPDIVLGLLDTLLVLDVDVDGDGTNESISAGFPFEAIPGELVGAL